jgi:hypothetical protein
MGDGSTGAPQVNNTIEHAAKQPAEQAQERKKEP